ncbi:MAG: poly-beta-1,6-N-acetyl-D-glucosamine synthase [Desulfobacteraceae bacterium]|jgi:biofilm PGA synthesis N-glycosyltransferase PgaC
MEAVFNMEVLFNFVFLYPLFMSYVWMIGTLLFHTFRSGKEEPHAFETPMPKASILIPCHNEQGCIRESIEFLMKQDYPDFEIIAIDDGSTDDTLKILSELQKKHNCLRVVSLKSNQGKGTALTMGALASQSEYLVCIDADALLDPQAVRHFVWHFKNSPRVGAITGNPRVRNRSTILGKIQVGEFSAVVNMIKAAQRIVGKIYTVSGVIAAFRKEALLSVGFWSDNMITEDVDISWKLQLKFWDIRYEHRALCWILMPETLQGVFRQRVRWAQGGNEVLLKYSKFLFDWRQRRIWPIYIEAMLGLLWTYCFGITAVLWILHFFIELPPSLVVRALFPPGWTGCFLALTCMLQFAIGLWVNRSFEKETLRLFFWLIWYPFLYWVINAVASMIGFPKALFKKRGALAVWESPDRGVQVCVEK